MRDGWRREINEVCPGQRGLQAVPWDQVLHYWLATDNGLMTVAMVIVAVFLVKGLIDAGVESFLIPKLVPGGRKKKKKRG
jgi:hypothetical protein